MGGGGRGDSRRPQIVAVFDGDFSAISFSTIVKSPGKTHILSWKCLEKSLKNVFKIPYEPSPNLSLQKYKPTNFTGLTSQTAASTNKKNRRTGPKRATAWCCVQFMVVELQDLKPF